MGAAGAVGRAFVDAWTGAPDVIVTGVDRNDVDAASGSWIVGDITAADPELVALVAAADVVLVAVPEFVAESAASMLMDTMRSDAALVDTLSVKSRWIDIASRHDGGPEIVGVNPMFRPALGFAGRPVAVVALRTGPRSSWLEDQLATWGSVLVAVAPDEHDRIMASVQALTHAAILAFGAALTELGHDVERLEPLFTPPHRTLLALLARIVGGDAHVYHDIQHANPFGSEARAALIRGIERLDEAATADDGAAFDAYLSDAHDLLGDRLASLDERCRTMFERS